MRDVLNLDFRLSQPVQIQTLTDLKEKNLVEKGKAVCLS